jgi:hypothetical protein
MLGPFFWVLYSLINSVARAQLARKNDTTTGSFCTRLFSPVSSCLYLPRLYLPCLYLPRTLGLSLFYTLSSHPRTAGHATSPGTQLQLIRAAGANHQIGFTCILVHLRSTQDVCVLYEEVRCKSYDLAAVPGAFGTAATPAPHNCQKECFLRNEWFLFFFRGVKALQMAKENECVSKPTPHTSIGDRLIIKLN